ncbi:MAG: nitroreductase family protein [bacterium]
MIPSRDAGTEHRDTVAALFARHSVRRYSSEPVEPGRLDLIRDFAAGVRPLVPASRFTCAIRAINKPSERLASALGSFTAIVSARHFLGARLAGSAHVLADFGFRVEQVVIELTRLGLGSCWVGTLRHEAAARALVGAGPDERMPAIVMFGRPAHGTAGRLVNRAIRAAVGARRRLDFAKFAFRDRFGVPLDPDADLGFILDCLRHAPSAGNARPWRVVVRGAELLICADENAGYYRVAGLAKWGYPLLDAGIGMAHVSIALAALGRPADWRWLDDTPGLRDELGLPASVRPVAGIALETS